MKTPECPTCKTDDIEMTDHEQLDLTSKPFDPELHAMFKCCNGHEFRAVLKISYEPPPEKFEGSKNL